MAAQQAPAVQSAAARPRNLRQKEKGKNEPPGWNMRAAVSRGLGLPNELREPL